MYDLAIELSNPIRRDSLFNLTPTLSLYKAFGMANSRPVTETTIY